jgi:hypothetical protein
MSKIKLYYCGWALLGYTYIPHLSCHYYKLATNSTFIVANWQMDLKDSIIMIIFYFSLAGSCILAILFRQIRKPIGIIAMAVHLTLGIIHFIRIWYPFKFEVFNIEWPLHSSLLEVFISIPCAFLALLLLLKEPA